MAAGVAAVSFTKLLYWIEGVSERRWPSWWVRAIALGLMVGVIGAVFNRLPPHRSVETDLRVDAAVARADPDNQAVEAAQTDQAENLASVQPVPPPLLGSGYEVIDHSLHLQLDNGLPWDWPSVSRGLGLTATKSVQVERDELWAELWWLLPLALLKPVMTSLTLAGGGSGGVFAPSLYIGATLGAAFGLLMNLLAPAYAVDPGVYAIVGMGAVVAGTTHGVLSAILIVYEMTNNYMVILPIMIAAGLSSVVAGFIDPESIYYKKLSRRGESIARGHDLHRLDHVMVRDVMIRDFPRLKQSDAATEIVRVAREHPQLESLPVMNEMGKLIGIIRPMDLHRMLESDVSPNLVNAEDIAMRAPISVSPANNILEAIRDFGAHDVETLPVETGKAEGRRLIGLLLRSDVMKRYREEILARH
jgi:CIC family chloride channel protein